MTSSVLLLLFFVQGSLAASCGSTGFPQSEKDAIVKNHNDLRSQIAKGTYVAKGVTKPAGANIAQMVWDCELENSAQAWAVTCPTGHSNYPGKGENLYWSYSSAPLTIDGKGILASNAWQNEFQQYGWPSNNLTVQLFNTGIGHATQMAWATTTHIGCGVQLCPSSTNGFPYEVVVVCQYTPQGNMVNANVYNTGNTCSGCQANAKCNSTIGLCGSL